MEDNYRTRIYDAYVNARKRPLAPSTIDGLETRRPYLQQFIRKFIQQNRKSKILELGCGHGALIHFLRKMGYFNVHGVDISQEQVAAAEHLNIDGVKHGDIIKTLCEIPADNIDCLISFDLIEHFNRKELIQLSDEAYRVLKKRGRWVIHTPNAESPFGMRMRYWDLTHEIAFTRTSLSQLLFSCGFTDIQYYEDKPIPHGIISFIRWMLWKIIRSTLRFYIAVETGDTSKDIILSQNIIAIAFK